MSLESMQKLWLDWKQAILAVVPESSEYYNLTDGVSDEDIQKLENQLGFKLPQILVDFYKVHNVEYNFVSSTFSLTGVDKAEYYLLPFERIFEAYDDEIMLFIGDFFDLNNEEDMKDKAEIVSSFDEKINCNDYANLKWIPFAETRQGDFLLIDTDPSEKGDMYQIIDLQNNSWKRIVIADSLETLIRDNIRKINNKEDERFEFILSELDNED